MKVQWNGFLPRRRYAIFGDVIIGEYMVIVNGDDIERAPKWGNFVGWFGGEKPEIQIDMCRLENKSNRKVKK
jgi:hypothetical protein